MTNYKTRSEMLTISLIITIIVAVGLGAACIGSVVKQAKMKGEMEAKAILADGFIDNAIENIKSSNFNEAIFSCLLAKEIRHAKNKDDLGRRATAAYEALR